MNKILRIAHEIVEAKHEGGDVLALIDMLADELPKNDAAHNTIEFVRVGFEICLHFHLFIDDSAILREVFLAAGDYNNFDAKAVADSFAELFLQTAGVEFGRESSPVLYVKTPAWTHQSVGARAGTRTRGERIPQAERDALIERIVAWAKTMDADEISVEEYNVVRIWWD